MLGVQSAINVDSSRFSVNYETLTQRFVECFPHNDREKKIKNIDKQWDMQSNLLAHILRYAITAANMEGVTHDDQKEFSSFTNANHPFHFLDASGYVVYTTLKSPVSSGGFTKRRKLVASSNHQRAKR